MALLWTTVIIKSFTGYIICILGCMHYGQNPGFTPWNCSHSIPIWRQVLPKSPRLTLSSLGSPGRPQNLSSCLSLCSAGIRGLNHRVRLQFLSYVYYQIDIILCLLSNWYDPMFTLKITVLFFTIQRKQSWFCHLFPKEDLLISNLHTNF